MELQATVQKEVIKLAVHLDKFRDDIIALRPIYNDRGKATRIYLREGEVQDPRDINSILIALAKLYAIDMKAQRRDMQAHLNRKGLMPFYLPKNRVFVPLKMRRPAAPKDRVYGYVDINYFGNVISLENGNCMLVLKEGCNIEILSKPKKVLQSQLMGRHLQEMLAQERNGEGGTRVLIEAGAYFTDILQTIIDELAAIKETMRERGGS